MTFNGEKYIIAMDYDAIVAIEDLQRQIDEMEDGNHAETETFNERT